MEPASQVTKERQEFSVVHGTPQVLNKETFPLNSDAPVKLTAALWSSQASFQGCPHDPLTRSWDMD